MEYVICVLWNMKNVYYGTCEVRAMEHVKMCAMEHVKCVLCIV